MPRNTERPANVPALDIPQPEITDVWVVDEKNEREVQEDIATVKTGEAE